MAAEFDRDAKARWYAENHTSIDPGVSLVYHLRNGAPAREIRLLEVNKYLPEMDIDPLEAVDFCVDRDTDFEHRLFVLDVTPAQWERIKRSELRLPDGWSLEGFSDPLAVCQ